MTDPERTRLVAGCAEFGLDLSSDLASRLLAYLDHLYFWNPSAGLTSVFRPEAVRLHLIDSLLLAPHLRGVETIADIGTGAGLPGIPLAISLDPARVTLVESRRRKCSFLREALRELAIRNCEVVEADAATLKASARRFDAVVSRAFMPPVEWVRFAAPLLEPGGRVLVAVGPAEDPIAIRAAALDSGLREVVRRTVSLPTGSETRTVYRLDRQAEEA